MFHAATRVSAKEVKRKLGFRDEADDKGKERLTASGQLRSHPARQIVANEEDDAFDAACAHIASGDLEATKKAIDYDGVDVTMTNVEDRTMLHVACATGQLDIVKYLVESGADVHARDFDGMTPIGEANRTKRENIVAYLRGIAKDSNHPGGKEWLKIVAQGRVEDVREEIERGADIHYEDNNNRTALHIAATKGCKPVVKLLVMNGANINATDRWGNSPIDNAMMKDHTEIVAYLRTIKERVDKKESETVAASLIHCAARNDLAELKALVKSGANPNCQSKYGSTALHKAVKKGHIELAVYLVKKAKADVNIVDSHRHTPLDIALIKYNTELIDLLKEYGGKKAWKLNAGPSLFYEPKAEGPFLPARTPTGAARRVVEPSHRRSECILS